MLLKQRLKKKNVKNDIFFPQNFYMSQNMLYLAIQKEICTHLGLYIQKKEVINSLYNLDGGSTISILLKYQKIAPRSK